MENGILTSIWRELPPSNTYSLCSLKTLDEKLDLHEIFSGQIWYQIMQTKGKPWAKMDNTAFPSWLTRGWPLYHGLSYRTTYFIWYTLVWRSGKIKVLKLSTEWKLPKCKHLRLSRSILLCECSMNFQKESH